MGQYACIRKALSYIAYVLFLYPVITVPIATTSTLLHLSPGLNFSMLPSYNLTSGDPFSQDRMFSVATPTLVNQGGFFPILSSRSFNASPAAYNSASIFGYSLGFYFRPQQGELDDGSSTPYCDMTQGCMLYLAICAGLLGSMNNLRQLGLIDWGADTVLNPYSTFDGFAAPVWFANLDSPISTVSHASLVVQSAAQSVGSTSSDALELQLRDGEKIVWRQPCGNAMEMLDTGHLNLIDNSTNRSDVVWQSTTDSLTVGQKLAVGQELVSSDSSYVARMEKGGLVFYMNKTRFNREPQPPPYWVFPLWFQDVGFKSLNQLILFAACTNSSATADQQQPGTVQLDPGTCTNASSSVLQIDSHYSYAVNSSVNILWRLETNGMLYSYAVSSSGPGSAASVTAIEPLHLYGVENGFVADYTPLALSWQDCSMPMICGPLGVCTPGAITLCSCPPAPYFGPVNSTDLLQGCKRTIDLPNCTSGHTSPTDFVQMNSTASVLLFSEWTFNSTPGAEMDACKLSCSSDCSCNGFFYQVNTSSCFFISDEISLMAVADRNYTAITQAASGTDFSEQSTIYARDYITLLKVAASAGASNRSQFKGALFEALAAIIAFVVIVCLVLGIASWCRSRARRTSINKLSREEAKELQDILPHLPYRFSYTELLAATEGFAKLLGAGGCGSVYAGVLPDGRKVAVKVLQAVYLQGIRQSNQFLAELATIGRTNHQNIVHLVGFCWEAARRLLVYEFVERGSLDSWIFVKQSASSTEMADAPLFLDWKSRYSVALGIARGLSYLHEECEQPILHFDIKPQNILLDNEFVAKLADFGMSRLIERDMSAVDTGMRGTPGYIAPEWCTQGRVSKRGDIYSMGMVLLEIVAGRRNLDFSLVNSDPIQAEEETAWHFPTWAASKCEQGQQMELVDTRLHEAGGFDAAQALRLIHVAFWCIQENPAMRPYAPTVVQWLEGTSAVEQPPFSTAVNFGKRNTSTSKILHSSFWRSYINSLTP